MGEAGWIGKWPGGRVRQGRHGKVWVIERSIDGERKTIKLNVTDEQGAMAELALFNRDPVST